MASFRPAARRYHAAVGAGQTMLVWGGRGEGIQTSTVESFDVTSLTWKEPRQLQGDLPIALASVAVASDGEKAYMFGGLSSRGLENKLFSLDLASLECRELVPSSTPRPSGREHCRMVCCGGKLVVYGGFSGSVIGASDDLYTFDLTSDKATWRMQATSGDKPPGLMGHSLTVIDGRRALLFGGSDGRSRHNDAYILDMETWKWSKLNVRGGKPPARNAHVACCISDARSGGRPVVAVVGGAGDRTRTGLSDVWFLDVDDGEWREVASVCPQLGHSGVVLGVESDSFRALVLFGGLKERGSIGSEMFETTLLLLVQREGSWLVDRVVSQADLETADDTLRQQMRRLLLPLHSTDERVRRLETELTEEQSRHREVEEIFEIEQLRRQAIMQESAELQSQLSQQVQHATQRAVQAENRARDAERQLSQANDRIREAEGEIVQVRSQLQESEARVRERGERLGEVEGQLTDMERALREGERNRRHAEERVRAVEGRLRTAIERQQEAEQRMIEAENTRRQVEQRQGDFERRVMENEQVVYRRVQVAEQSHQEALHRSQLAENRLSEETRRRIELERQNQQLEAQLREAERVALSLQTSSPARDDIFWRVEKREVHLSQHELGRGGWAAVKVAEFRGLQVAAKCLHSVIISDHNRQLFLREMNMAAKLRHPHLVQFIGATLEGEPIILTELMSTSLRDVLGRGRLMEQQITSISRHVALALNYMHLLTPDPILHRDVSSANVLLSPAPEGVWVAKLSDYGSANFTRLVSTAGPGNPSYAAPEASDPARQSPKMDVFSFGVLLVEMASGQFPNRDNLPGQLRRVSPPRLLQLVQRCIHDNPTRRPTIALLLSELV